MEVTEFAKQLRQLCAEASDLANRVVECDLSTESDHLVAQAVVARAKAVQEWAGAFIGDPASKSRRADAWREFRAAVLRLEEAIR